MDNMHIMWVFVMHSLHNSMINELVKLKVIDFEI
jgi:hypothetical protein